MSMKWKGFILIPVLLAVLLLSGVSAKEAFAPTPGSIELFDVKKGAVLKRTDMNGAIRHETERLIQSAGGQADIFRADPEDGIILKLPLNPPVEVKKPGFHTLASEVFLFLPKGKNPYILIFSDSNEPRLFALSGNADELLRLCRWEKYAEQSHPGKAGEH